MEGSSSRPVGTRANGDETKLIYYRHGEKTRTWARLELSRMSRQSGTFILTPSDHSDVVCILKSDHLVCC